MSTQTTTNTVLTQPRAGTSIRPGNPGSSHSVHSNMFSKVEYVALLRQAIDGRITVFHINNKAHMCAEGSGQLCAPQSAFRRRLTA